jgi:hypothetical protein
MFMEMWVLVIHEIATNLEQEKDIDHARQLRSLAEGAYVEIRKGAFFKQHLRVVVGRKL